MSAMWVLLELVALAALVVLVCIAVYAHQKESGPSGLQDGEFEEPEWWPEFEREFARYVADLEAARHAQSTPPPRLRRSRRPDSA